MKGNMKYFFMYFLLGMSCGSVFGLGISVALHKIIILPVCVSIGMALGAVLGALVKKQKDSEGK